MNKLSVPFNRPCWAGNEMAYISDAFANGWISGDGSFTKKAQQLLEKQLGGVEKVLLTTSCTHALEMAAILLNFEPGDEVIVPSFTFVSTALAFIMHGATLVFSDVRPDTLNLDESKLELLITENTRAIVPVHYAGVGCEMDIIMEIAQRYDLVVIEDNAHGLYGKYRNRYLGTLGHMATQSFHETKNITCGEGGALIINDPKYIKRAEIIREKGTDRARFFRGQVDKYTWVDKGSSYVMSDILAAALCAQLEQFEEIQVKRRVIWGNYRESLETWAASNDVSLPVVPDYCDQAYHMFYLLMPSLKIRTQFIAYLRDAGVSAVFHYLPLHESEQGQKSTCRPANCPVTQDVTNRLVRLPFFNNMTTEEHKLVIEETLSFKC